MKIVRFIQSLGSSFKVKLIYIVSFIIFLSVTVVTLLAYHSYSKYFVKQTKEKSMELIEQIGLNVNTYLDELFRLVDSPYYDDSVMAALEYVNRTKEDSFKNRRLVERYLGSVMTIPRNDILRVYVLTDFSLYSYTKTPYDMAEYATYLEADWYGKAKNTKEAIFLPVHFEKILPRSNSQIFSIVRRLCSKKDNSLVLGVIKVDANYEGIRSICDKVSVEEKEALLIIDHSKNIIYERNQGLSEDIYEAVFTNAFSESNKDTIVINGEKYISNTYGLSSTDWTVISVKSYRQLNFYFSKVRNAAIYVSAICIVIAVVILILFMNQFLKPLFSIINLMKQVENENLEVQFHVKKKDEIAYLGNSFNHMVTKIKQAMVKNELLVKELYEARYLQKESQFNALCSQIRPHFIYNTLNTINLLIKCEEYEKAVKNIEMFSLLLRGIMNSNTEITMEQEIKIVSSYLGLQESRYDGEFSYEIDVHPKYHSYMIPALTLQPLVENAVIHGAENKRGKSKINICTAEEECFYILVIDDGPGIPTEKLSWITKKLEEQQEAGDGEGKFEDSIGLINVHRRLQLYYGKEYGIQIWSNVMKGTTVKLRLPKSQY